MLCFLKKTFGVCLIGLGIGMLLVLLLPFAGWLFIIGAILIIVGLLWLAC
jgi:hypothetical protein